MSSIKINITTHYSFKILKFEECIQVHYLRHTLIASVLIITFSIQNQKLRLNNIDLNKPVSESQLWEEGWVWNLYWVPHGHFFCLQVTTQHSLICHRTTQLQPQPKCAHFTFFLVNKLQSWSGSCLASIMQTEGFHWPLRTEWVFTHKTNGCKIKSLPFLFALSSTMWHLCQIFCKHWEIFLGQRHPTGIPGWILSMGPHGRGSVFLQQSIASISHLEGSPS